MHFLQQHASYRYALSLCEHSRPVCGLTSAYPAHQAPSVLAACGSWSQSLVPGITSPVPKRNECQAIMHHVVKHCLRLTQLQRHHKGDDSMDTHTHSASLLQSDDSPDRVKCDPALRSLFGQDSLKLSELGSRVGPMLLPLPPHTLTYTIRYLTLT